MTGMALESRLALRGLARRPWAAAAAVISLALGFAVQIVVSSCANTLFWRDLAVPQAAEAVTIYGHSELVGTLTNIAYPQAARLRDAGVFRDVTAFTRFRLVWETEERAERVNVEMVDGNYFALLRPPLAAGRAPEGADEAVLGHDFWTSRFASDPGVLGRAITLGGERYVVTGVMGREYRGTLLDYMGNPKLWVTIEAQRKLPFLQGIDLRQNWAMNWFVGAARLRPGVTLAQASEAVAAYEARNPAPSGATPRTARLFPAQTANFHPAARGKVRATAALFAGLGGLLLLLGCLNVSFFLASKAFAESRQTAMERALGASAARLAGRRALEALALAAAALTGGAALAQWGIAVLTLHPPPLAMIVLRPEWDWRVWLAALGYAAVAAAVIAVAPAWIAWRSSRRDPQPAIAGRAWRRLAPGEPLVAAQAALAVAILIASGFVLRGVAAAYRDDAGFDARGLVMAETDLYGAGASGEQSRAIIRIVLDRLRQQPATQEAAAAALMPLSAFRIPAWVRVQGGERLHTFSNAVSASYFGVLRLRLIAGRGFRAGQAGAEEAVVNETLAAKLAPAGSVLGRTIELVNERGEAGRRFTVTGVVRDARYHSLWREPVPYLYQSAEAWGAGNTAFIVRTAAPPSPAWQAIRDALRAVEPRALLAEPRTGEAQMAALAAEQKYAGVFFGLLGCVALAVASGGAAASLQMLVSRRRREIGIRLALGAARARIVRMVFARGLMVAGSGLAAGLLLGGGLQRWLRPLAPGAPEGGPWPAILASAILLIASSASIAIPAWRAARTDPWKSLQMPD